ncbi:hypothetical protein LJ656_13580 [Paraburkholderia sp. MMS20-SJTR3]|uniref:Uncharacterized protein n=1 Tax=Paraburkholderia sejongensis TaxID=2886946 RepID=A0ABS8JUP2_9BURK|nr:hypothetical protein [Paraburkholderia sp. MMS20-SJTR3]MCC8393620.1 hypothetical protein [Paraburkholderia sp. MMS20-SJTR3]
MKTRIAALAILSLSTFAAASGDAISTVDAAADKAAEVTRMCRLSTNQTKCLLFDVSDHKSYFMVGVHEKHSPECGGDPASAPALFFMKIRKRDGAVLTNQKDGEHFRPLWSTPRMEGCNAN